ncbi:putative baseplate assembly protein [Tessaracoccus bendigoensis DSM 12906]|uniref:Putative baseplate assembly protein n=1 Tax=Tessaracoccus bendigoensis DSM 12906 TaxID=1123357 RepID=A0A1M6GG56_9ACTN|nr:baseplate J/gp47 family protein [Tessaracoccus bendigoensis]SHJ08873.1 putative baseplate assembly protein [Tessaracoccus bendigoensis DSM 12906]
MSLPLPNLDDRDYGRLLADAKLIAARNAPEWTDFTPGDPGVTLLELFAFLTENMIFRLNRLPEKARIAFCNLYGASLLPPASARVTLTFSGSGEQNATVPRGTRVTTAAAGGPEFVTLASVTVSATDTVTVTAQHCVVHDAEVLGTTSGRPFQRFETGYRPLVLPAADAAGLFLGTEVFEGELDDRVPAARLGDGSYRLWHEVARLDAAERDRDAFVVDRTSGTITLGSGAVGGPAPVGRRVAVSYRTGGGASGNVRAGTLTSLVDQVQGVTVVNHEPATGGRDGETVAAALDRIAAGLYDGDRVVTATDYERAAVAAHGGVGRAAVHTTAELWNGGEPGDVSVLLVPSASDAEALSLRVDEILARQLPEVAAEVSGKIALRQPLGITHRVGWVGWKRFHIEASVVLHRAENLDAARQRLAGRLARTLTPFPFEGRPGWDFGEPLRASTIFDVLLSERGVRYVDDVRLVVDEVPGDVSTVIADPHQPGMWFCGSDERVFRSRDAQGWELVARWPGEHVERLAACAGRPGSVLAVSRIGEDDRSRVHASADHGETWYLAAEFEFHVEDIAVGASPLGPVAFLATDKGLYRLALTPGEVPEPVLLAAQEPDRACYAVAVVSEPGSELQVAVAAQELGGVMVSFSGAKPGTYQEVGLKGIDIRLLRVQRSPGRRFLLAGAYATGEEAGAGVQRLELQPYQPSPEGWRPVGSNWVGGSCRDLITVGDRVFAATARSAVTRADTSAADRPWRAAAVDSGLPLQEVGRFRPIQSVAGDQTRVLAGCVGGIWASTDGVTWRHASDDTFTDAVTLPRTWLFAPGEHVLNVGHDDARH